MSLIQWIVLALGVFLIVGAFLIMGLDFKAWDESKRHHNAGLKRSIKDEG